MKVGQKVQLKKEWNPLKREPETVTRIEKGLFGDKIVTDVHEFGLQDWKFEEVHETH